MRNLFDLIDEDELNIYTIDHSFLQNARVIYSTTRRYRKDLRCKRGNILENIVNMINVFCSAAGKVLPRVSALSTKVRCLLFTYASIVNYILVFRGLFQRGHT